MLGYVRVNKPEMKVKEYETYRGLYCSLCKSLGKYYGQLSRMILSYDVTFLLIVLISSQNKVPEFKKGHCPFNPAKKCAYCTNCDENLKFAASVTVLMFYYKIKDNISDGGFFKKLLMFLLLPYASLLRHKAKKLYPKLDSIISLSMTEQAKVERSYTDSVDKAAHNSADALGKIFDFENCDSNSTLYRLGYFVGRWVYIADAADDIEKDLKASSFNVFINKYAIEDISSFDEAIKDEIEKTLFYTQSFVEDACRKNDFKILAPIIDNIIYDSMRNTINTVVKGNKNQ